VSTERKPLRPAGYLVVLTTMWGALSFHWTVLTNNVVPTRALDLRCPQRGQLRLAKPRSTWASGIAGTFPQVLAPGIGGVLLDTFNRLGHTCGYPVVFAMVVVYLLAGIVMLVKVTEPAPPPSVAVPALG